MIQVDAAEVLKDHLRKQRETEFKKMEIETEKVSLIFTNMDETVAVFCLSVFSLTPSSKAMTAQKEENFHPPQNDGENTGPFYSGM